MLLITGPNMGGKSTYMRQTALITLLAHIGSFVPAQAATLSTVDRIFTRIGASDDLASGRSTFMVEMTETANILHNASARSLVLMDEIGRGTSTFDGLSLAWAAARQLAEELRAFTLFATHYFELTALPEQLPTVRNVHLDAVEHRDHVVFMHRIQEGPGQSQLRPAGGAPCRRAITGGGSGCGEARGTRGNPARCGSRNRAPPGRSFQQFAAPGPGAPRRHGPGFTHAAGGTGAPLPPARYAVTRPVVAVASQALGMQLHCLRISCESA
jgi:hypothetical protein